MKLGPVRCGLRILLTVMFSLVMYLLGVVLKLFTIGAPRRRFHLLARATSFWGRGVSRIWGMRIVVEGTPPSPPFYLVSNHLSYTDIVLMCAVSPGWFVSKSEVASWPGIGPLTRMGLTIFIDRETRRDVHRMNQLICRLVEDGGGIGFYPEGTTTDGTHLLPFKPSLLQPAVELGIPVTCAAIRYETPAGSPPPEEVVAWVGDTAFAPHLTKLLSGRGFTARVRFADEPVRAEDRKQLAQLAHDRVFDMLRTLRAHSPALSPP